MQRYLIRNMLGVGMAPPRLGLVLEDKPFSEFSYIVQYQYKDGLRGTCLLQDVYKTFTRLAHCFYMIFTRECNNIIYYAPQRQWHLAL